jgi:hypothetical protein
MIDYDGMRATVVKGLKDYLNCPIVRANQTEKPPKYPYVTYTITQLLGENNGRYGAYGDGKDRKMFNQTWSISALSDDNTESVTLAIKAREWLDHIGHTYLSDNNVVVQSIGSVMNRDNVISIEYEYKNGFDVVFTLFDVVDNPHTEFIETADVNGTTVKPKPTEEELADKLAKRLDGEL